MYTEEVVFLIFSYLMLQMKNENRYSGSYFYILVSVFWIRKREKETWLPYLYFPLWNRRMKNERTVYTTRGCFPFIMFSSCKRKKRKWVQPIIFLFFVFCLMITKKEKDAFLLSFYFLLWNRKNEKRKDCIFTDRVSPLYPLRPVVVCGILLGLILSMIQMYLSPYHIWQLHTIIYRIVWTALVAQPIWPAHLAHSRGSVVTQAKAVSEHYMILLYDHTGRNIHRSFN